MELIDMRDFDSRAVRCEGLNPSPAATYASVAELVYAGDLEN